jgi:hypothetical protein
MEDLIQLLRKELIQLESYLAVTKRLLVEDIYAYGEILSERDNRLKGYQETVERIKATAAGLPDRAAVTEVINGQANPKYPV